MIDASVGRAYARAMTAPLSHVSRLALNPAQLARKAIRNHRPATRKKAEQFLKTAASALPFPA